MVLLLALLVLVLVLLLVLVVLLMVLLERRVLLVLSGSRLIIPSQISI